MSFTYNGTDVQGVTYNGTNVQSITYNGVEVWSGTTEINKTFSNAGNLSIPLKGYGYFKVDYTCNTDACRITMNVWNASILIHNGYLVWDHGSGNLAPYTKGYTEHYFAWKPDRHAHSISSPESAIDRMSMATASNHADYGAFTHDTANNFLLDIEVEFIGPPNTNPGTVNFTGKTSNKPLWDSNGHLI